MDDKRKKFEEFFYSERNSICGVEEVCDYAEEHNGDYSPYKGHMFCPECKKAELTFTHKTLKRQAYLWKIESSHHLESCSYICGYAPKEYVKQYIDNLTYNQVQDRLNSIINMLCGDKTKKNTSPSGNGVGNIFDNNPMLIPDGIKGSVVWKTIRRKRLAGLIDKADGTYLYVFYGEVKLSVEEKSGVSKSGEEYYYHLLTIKTQNKKREWKYRTSIYRRGIKDNVNEEKVYQIAMIGRLNFKYRWPQIDLINKNAIRYREI